MNAPWRIELFGGLQLLGENHTVSRFQTRKTGALLGYLAYHKEKPISREVLADLFWPENEPEAARNSLRVALNSLRRQLEPPGIPTGGVLTADRAFVWLSGQAVVTDTFEFDRALKAERLAGESDESTKINHLLQAVELYKGPLLLGWYEEWIDSEQNRLAEVYAGALRRLTGLLYKNREFDRALEFAQKAVLSDPLQEENHRHLMRLYAAIGRPDAAFGAFRELEVILREQMNVPPSPVTRDLVKQIAALPVSEASPFPQAGETEPGPQSVFATALNPTLVLAAPVVPEENTETGEPSETGAETEGSVPLQWTRFWGRDAELATLHHLLRPQNRNPLRLATLTGPGGVGKTRLAIETATRLRENEYAGRVWFVCLDVAPYADTAEVEAQILREIAHVLRLPDISDAPPEGIYAALLRTLRSKNTAALLVLDDVPQTESGLWACARIATRLLEAAPNLRCLVTSRQRLHAAFEREVLVLPLPIPDVFVSEDKVNRPAPVHLLETLAACPSVALFVERAQAVRSDFQITPRNAYALTYLCQKLDGLPLALELAAAWSRLLTPAQMVERTRENCFALLVSERRDLAPRRRSLHMLLSDACRDLSTAHRAFLVALSVFDGGFTLHAAQFVGLINHENKEPAPDALAFLDALQARSLLFARETETGLRFYLLHTTRCFVSTLTEPEAEARAEAAHAQYFADLAQAAQAHLPGSAAPEWRVRLADEQENLRGLLYAACDASASPQTVLRGLQTASALWRFWYARGEASEGGAFLEKLLQHPAAQEAPSLLRARALHGAGRLALIGGRGAQAGAFLEESFELLRACSASDAAVQAHPNLTPLRLAKDLALAAQSRSDGDAARHWLRILLNEYKNANDAWGMAQTLGEIGRDALEQGDWNAAEAALAKSAYLRRALGDGWGASEADAARAQALLEAGDTKGEALLAYAESQMAQSDVHAIAVSFLNLGCVAEAQNDWEAALPLLRDAADLFKAQNDCRAAALVWWLIARAAARQNETALALSAAEEALMECRIGKLSSAENDAPEPIEKTSAVPKTEMTSETRVFCLAERLVKQLSGQHGTSL